MLSVDRMSSAVKYNYTDWMFGGLMVLLCAGLTVLRSTTGPAKSRMPNWRASAPISTNSPARWREVSTPNFPKSCGQLLPPRGHSANQLDQTDFLARFTARGKRQTRARDLSSRIARWRRFYPR